MLSRIALTLGYALTLFAGSTGIANAATDKSEVMTGVFILVVASMILLTLIYSLKWYLGLTEPPPLPPGGLPYYSLPADGDAHGHDAPGHH
jgi:hypothetical protein